MAPMLDPTAFDLVVFDKDGTLVDLHAPWGGWAEAVLAGLAPHLDPAEALPRLGWNREEGRIRPESPLAVATDAALAVVLTTWLYEGGMGWSHATALVRGAIEAVPLPIAPPLCPLDALFQRLLAAGFQLAVVTADTHAGVERDLGAAGLLPALTIIIGADAGLPPKPGPEMFWEACARAGVSPARAVMVGDATGDLRMGRAGGAGLTVGVLSGSGSAALLAPDADWIIPSVCHLTEGWEAPH